MSVDLEIVPTRDIEVTTSLLNEEVGKFSCDGVSIETVKIYDWQSLRLLSTEEKLVLSNSYNVEVDEVELNISVDELEDTEVTTEILSGYGSFNHSLNLVDLATLWGKVGWSLRIRTSYSFYESPKFYLVCKALTSLLDGAIIVISQKGKYFSPGVYSADKF